MTLEEQVAQLERVMAKLTQPEQDRFWFMKEAHSKYQDRGLEIAQDIVDEFPPDQPIEDLKAEFERRVLPPKQEMPLQA